jgi:hypothetical protein
MEEKLNTRHLYKRLFVIFDANFRRNFCHFFESYIRTFCNIGSQTRTKLARKLNLKFFKVIQNKLYFPFPVWYHQVKIVADSCKCCVLEVR